MVMSGVEPGVISVLILSISLTFSGAILVFGGTTLILVFKLNLLAFALPIFPAFPILLISWGAFSLIASIHGIFAVLNQSKSQIVLNALFHCILTVLQGKLKIVL
jgi:hypothetical protein